MRRAVLMPLAGCVGALGGGRRAEGATGLAIAPLRHQPRPLQRRAGRPARRSQGEKPPLAVLVAKPGRAAADARGQLSRAVLLVQPATALKWQRELVRGKRPLRRRQRGARPPIAAEVEARLLRLAAGNPRRGYGRLRGELAKLGHPRGRSTARDILKRRHAPPAPRRGQRSVTWRQPLAEHRGRLLACDFFTVATLVLKALYALRFRDVGSRRGHLVGGTARPTAVWVTQQARQRAWTLQEEGPPVRHLIHDRDAKFPPAFDAVFAAEGVGVIRTPYRAPNANAHAERWIRSAREECLDHLRVVGEAHLRRVLRD